MTGRLGFLVALLTLHALYAGSETALQAVNRLRLHHLVRTGMASARAVQALMVPTRRTLPAVRLAVAWLRGGFLLLLWHAAGTGRGGSAVGMVVLGCFALAILGDAVPRTWFLLRPIDRLYRIAGALNRVERWFGWLFRALRPDRSRRPEDPDGAEPVMTRETLHRLVQDGVETGAISPMERAMISRVFELQQLPVRDMMVPESRMITLDAEATLAEFYERSRETGFIRMPVRDPAAEGGYAGIINLFHVVGQTDDESRRVRDFLRPPLFVPEATAVADLLPKLRRNRQPMALVCDASGRGRGLITIDDVLAAVVTPTGMAEHRRSGEETLSSRGGVTGRGA